MRYFLQTVVRLLSAVLMTAAVILSVLGGVCLAICGALNEASENG